MDLGEVLLVENHFPDRVHQFVLEYILLDKQESHQKIK